LQKVSETLSNAQVAELLAREAEHASGHMQRALRSAARRAFLWPEEASELVRQGRSLSAELPGVGPYLEGRIRRWVEQPEKTPVEEAPAIRSGFLTLTAARLALANEKDWLGTIKGDLQMHSEWSDGSGSIREMAEAAVERGYEFIAITDHTKGLKIAGGIDEAQLREQAQEIDGINASLRAQGVTLQLLSSAELNLTPKGEGDMEEDALAALDLVLGCFHSALRKKEDQTARYIAALRNRSIDILGHPRGRIYNFRLGLSADWPRVFAVAAELDKAVEIDGYPDRQDLSPDLLAMARAAGCRISLGTDAHDPAQLRFMEFAAASALLASIPRERILNCMRRDDLIRWARGHREQRRAA
jgi:histidinol phosphatase-like PHP family hydrolase